MAEQFTQNQDSTNYSRAGILIISVGIIVLLLTRSFVKNHFPGQEWLWPLILLGCIMVVAVTVIQNPWFRLILALTVLLGLISFNSGNEIFRKILGFACIGFGLLLIYQIIAKSFLSK